MPHPAVEVYHRPLEADRQIAQHMANPTSGIRTAAVLWCSMHVCMAELVLFPGKTSTRSGTLIARTSE